MNLREWRGMGTGSSRRADICYYTYVYSSYMVDQVYQPIFYSYYQQLVIFHHCISIAAVPFQLDETVLTIVSLKPFLTTKDIRDIILRSIASPSNGADCMCEGTGFFPCFPLGCSGYL